VGNRLKKIVNRENISYVLTAGSILLILWQISIFRKTFISVQIPLTIMIGGGLLVFFLFRSKVSFFIDTSYNIFWQSIHAIILFGGILVFSFMAANYFITLDSEKTLRLEVIKVGDLAKGGSKYGSSCAEPYAIVEYNNTQKQLVFPCNTDLKNTKYINVALHEGLFGFIVVKKMHPLIIEENNAVEAENNLLKEYLQLLSAAEESYSVGNLPKSIELYERAIELNPDDNLSRLRLNEIKGETDTLSNLKQ